jgi:hypothetical protein
LLSAIRGATPPSRNNLSHANRQRDPALAEHLFWQLFVAGLVKGRQSGSSERAPGF